MYGRTGELSPRHGITGELHPSFGKSNPKASERCKLLVGELNPCYGRVGELHPMYGKKNTKLAEFNRKTSMRKRYLKKP